MNPSSTSMDPRRLPMTVELAIVSGFGLVAYFAPQMPHAMRATVRVIGPPLNRTYILLSNSIARRWAPYSKKLKRGSIIRVIGSILPDFVFEPAGRIFISGMHSSGRLIGMDTAEFDKVGIASAATISLSLENNPEGVIVAFQLDPADAESECPDDYDSDSETENDIEEEDVSSNPEGWEQNNDNFSIQCFYPGASSTRFLACSTPTPINPANMNDSFGTEATDLDDNNGKTQEEIAGLKLMIQTLMEQMSALNENMSIRHNKTEIQIAQSADSLKDCNNLSANFPNFPPPPPLPCPKVPAMTTGPVGPLPPPPPPPPMPAMIFQGSTKLPLVKKSKQNSEPVKPVLSMSDILKDLPNVKLRSVQRSPGGTPIKGPKADDKGSLEFVLKKRFESLHSPAQSDNEEDKENGFDDSFLSNASPRLESKLKSVSIFNRKSNGNRKSIEKQPLFGPHLLKKRALVPATGNVLGEKTNNY